MKIAVAFLLVAVSCFFDSGYGFLASGGVKQVSSNNLIPQDCLEKLIRVDLPQSLEKLQHLLCLYMKGKKTQNEELYRKFLSELHTLLIDAGCTADQILSIPNTLEKVGDEVGKLAEQLGFEILKTVESLGVSDIVLNALCDLLGETLKTLSQSLGGLNLNVANGVLKGVPILG